MDPDVSGDHARETNFEEASSRLNEGLESCRALVETYRELLTGDHPAAANEYTAAANDDGEEAATG
jgi:hypothetical protein